MPKRSPESRPKTAPATANSPADPSERPSGKGKIDPVRFLSYDLIMKLIHESKDNDPVRIDSFRFHEEPAPDSSAAPDDAAPPNTDSEGPDEPLSEEDDSTITVPEDATISEPPPSYMARNTNRPPLKRDLRSLADYHARKKNR